MIKLKRCPRHDSSNFWWWGSHVWVLPKEVENAPRDKLGILLLPQLLHDLSYVRDSVYSIPIIGTKKVQYILISDIGSVQMTLQQSIWVDVLHCVLKETKHS